MRLQRYLGALAGLVLFLALAAAPASARAGMHTEHSAPEIHHLHHHDALAIHEHNTHALHEHEVAMHDHETSLHQHAA